MYSNCFKIHSSYSKSLLSINVNEFSWSWILKDRIVSNFKKRVLENCCLAFMFSTKRKIRQFYVMVILWQQRNVQKSVIQVQSCCFANLLFCHFCCHHCRCCLSSLLLQATAVWLMHCSGKWKHITLWFFSYWDQSLLFADPWKCCSIYHPLSPSKIFLRCRTTLKIRICFLQDWISVVYSSFGYFHADTRERLNWRPKIRKFRTRNVILSMIVCPVRPHTPWGSKWMVKR